MLKLLLKKKGGGELGKMGLEEFKGIVEGHPGDMRPVGSWFTKRRD